MGVGLFLVASCHLILLQAQQVDSKCQKSYTCRSNLTLEFPFTKIDNPECGLFMVDGCDNPSLEHPILRLGDSTRPKYLLGKASENRFLIIDFELQTLLDRSRKCYTFVNVSLPQSPSVSFTFPPDITFVRCSNSTPDDLIEDYFQDYSRESCQVSTAYYKILATPGLAPAVAIPAACSFIRIPINKSRENSTKLLELLTPSFELEWKVSEGCIRCFNRGGQCLADAQNEFYCKTGIAYALIIHLHPL